MNPADTTAGLDVAYYVERLAEPGLIDAAVAVEIAPGAYEPAVPCGPGRAAGHLTVLDPGLAERAVAQLQDHKGFPGVRPAEPEPGRGAWPIEWGEPVPELPGCGHRLCAAAHHLHAGIAYGYRARVIRAFVGPRLLTEF